MSKKSIKCGDKKVNKSNFYQNKKLFKIDDIDVDKILISKKNRMVKIRYEHKVLYLLLQMLLLLYH